MAFKKTIGTGASEDRLENLILERLTPGVDKDKIDRRIWDLFGEEWCVMFTDLSGFSRGVEKFGIIHFLQTIHESERVLVPIIESFDGILLKAEGDSLLVIFRNADKALDAAVKMQNELKIYNKDKIPEEQILLCVGLGYGKVLKIGDTDVFGSEVNTASKLGEDIAEVGDILVTYNVFEKVQFESYNFEEIPNPPAGTSKAYRFIYK
ncbi:MAG: adenylate/guanylate cyclase domain-containing protein [Leptospiraceae bacterium]|jgi:class 3 adenylate cyclase|nr:adenylate/guanylate cyclase domain-containing protein [Leptospiraceae bacterium]MCZ8347272.1 adenylate/guanylate cyclase domain-containing protein [Leptospiraceae bacterium]PJE04835.1 MAG: adenylate cyclase [Leptospira sp.]